ncbi:hypothetical protein, partial [Helicobacter sp. 13S00401-1]|uniref:hypothetical protein n=1 Tax=Helicobacter sp. 13S00401-1 TaxID=1905758 RepID=UPI00117AC132
MNQVTNKVTRIILATTLIASFSSVAMAATHHKREHRHPIPVSHNYDIHGIKFMLGAGAGTGLSAQGRSNGFTIRAPYAGLDARLRLGTGIFTTTKSSTLGLQASIGVGANGLGASSNFNPQYFVNLDFIQAFKIGHTGYFKLGYIIGGGVAIRTYENVDSGSGDYVANSAISATTVGSTTSTNTTLDSNSSLEELNAALVKAQALADKYNE